MANNPKKYASDNTLSAVVAKIKELFVKKTDFDTALSNKADKSHPHAISDVTNLQSTLDGKATQTALNSHTSNTDIHFTAAERTKLSGIAAGAQVNTITGVKGNSETSYRTGNINITKANIGLGNVDNTSDANKPISTAQQLAFDSVNDAIDTHTENDDIHVTTTNKTNWNSAHTHSTSAHARVDATKVEDSSTNGNIKINGTETNVYSHPNSGVSAGTYKSVTVNAQGHVTGGSNPTTLAGFGITDGETKGTASSVVSTHNTSTSAHGDIRDLITGLTTRLNTLANSDDTTLDQMSEIVAYIKANKALIDSVTTTKVNVADIVNNLTTNVTNKPLSAAQGVAIKTLIDALQDELDNHTHSGSDITSGTVAAARLPKATGSASGIVSTESQTFAGEKTFTSNITTVGLRANAANTNDIGTSLAPFRNTNTKNLYIAPQNIGGSISHYGKFIAETTGTTTTKGITRLEVGNFIEEGRDGNAQGCIQIFNNDTGSIILETGHDDDRDIRIYLPENPGTLVTTDDLSGYAKSTHNHSASNITSGILPIARGGTGNMNGYVQIGALSGSTVGALATAEGRNTTASGSYSHAEGNYTEATGSSSHAEGQNTTASNTAAHAEGENTTASGAYSHAEGENTIASAKHQHVQGKFNKEDSAGTYAHIVGNGTGASSSKRSNAHTLDWNGNAWFAGNIYVGGTSQNSGSSMLSSIATVTTAEYEALEKAQATNANTLYMLTDAEEEVIPTVQFVVWEEND